MATEYSYFEHMPGKPMLGGRWMAGTWSLEGMKKILRKMIAEKKIDEDFKGELRRFKGVVGEDIIVARAIATPKEIISEKFNTSNFHNVMKLSERTRFTGRGTAYYY